MCPQDKHWRQTSLLYLYTAILILNQRIISKDDIEFVTEFPCLLGHPECKMKRTNHRFFLVVWQKSRYFIIWGSFFSVSYFKATMGEG